jgi:hypothetical protein
MAGYEERAGDDDQPAENDPDSLAYLVARGSFGSGADVIRDEPFTANAAVVNGSIGSGLDTTGVTRPKPHGSTW